MHTSSLYVYYSLFTVTISVHCLSPVNLTNICFCICMCYRVGRQSLRGGAHLIHPERVVISDAIVWVVTEAKIVCAYETIPAWSGICFCGNEWEFVTHICRCEQRGKTIL